tara:strand:+ start:22549 stop:27597 length:5049 start_codon:yes stop_codon:yes gene_type:complete
MASDDLNRTAYAQALAKIQGGASEEDASMPSYMVASDTMNVANGNKTFLESAVDTVQSIPKFIGVSMISGANQLYNIPSDIGNLFGGDFERSDTAEVISGLDSNLGAFYEENQTGADLVGFMLSSTVPGLGGIKLLNAGQKSLSTAINAGKFGESTGKALGLLVPNKAGNLAKAIAEVTTSSAPASIMNRNALKAIGAGVGQNALEALAFEVAVTATMFQSPILENQDFGDFVTNVAFGAGVFGLVGGAVDAAKISSKLKFRANEASIEARPWSFIPEAAENSSSYEKLVLDYDTMNNIPAVPFNVSPERHVFLTAAAKNKREVLDTRIRGEISNIAGGDQDVAAALYSAFKTDPIEATLVGRAAGKQTSFQAQEGAFVGLLETTKMGVTGAAEKAASKLEIKALAGKLNAADQALWEVQMTKTTYVKAWGEDAGRVYTESPVVTSLIDKLGKGQIIKVDASGVKAGSKKYTFDTKYNTGKGTSPLGAPIKPWDITKVDALAAQARYIWASKLKPFAPTAKEPLAIHVNDIPLMEKAMAELTQEQLLHVKFKGLAEGEVLGSSLQKFIANKKIAIANDLLTRPTQKAGLLKGEIKELTQDEIAAVVNVKSKFLSGEILSDSVGEFHIDDILAMQSHNKAYNESLVGKGLRSVNSPEVPVWSVPQHLKMTYDMTPFENVDNMLIENMVIIKQQQKVYQEGTGRAAANVLGRDYDKFEDISSNRVMKGANPTGAQSNALAAADGNYGSLASTMINIGKTTNRVIEKFQESTRSSLEPLLFKLGASQKATIEWSTLQQKIRSLEGQYGLNAAGDALEPLVMLRWQRAAIEATEAGRAVPKQPVFKAGTELHVPIVNKEVRDLAAAHIEINARRTEGLAGIRSSQGAQFNRDPDAFYPIPVDPKDYPFFALVTDESITSGNHTKTLFATTEKDLLDQAARLKQNPHLKVRFKQEAEDYYKSIGQFDYEKTINNNYLDVEAHRKGVSAPFTVATDPQKVSNDMLKWHMQRESGLVREAVAAKYEVQFAELQGLGRDATVAATSTFSKGAALSTLENSVSNPFAGYIKTALGIKNTAEYPFLVNVNRMADAKLSAMYNKITGIAERSKSTDDLAAINVELERAGYKGAQYDESMEIFANAGPDRGVLSRLVGDANGILATVVLRWDALNAVNNAVSANVLLGAETKAVLRAIGRGDSDAAGALAGLTRVAVPGTDKTIFSATKLISNAVKKFNTFDHTSTAEFKFYKDNNYFTDISKQHRDILEDLTYNPALGTSAFKQSIERARTKITSAANLGEKFTGNKLAEEFNRFVAADVMKQMTDVATSRGLMTAKEQLAYINTFVNRTQGNYLAAQRPMMFHGPLGQAVGLFQTYQFNLMQQLLRHVGEGRGKDAMTLFALQGSIHGMNGLPAFNAINTHLIGNASGNVEHRDAYDATYGIAGKNAGDWLMYGAASNALGLIHPDLKVNLYTRGDINPRHLTIIPTNPADVAAIATAGKVFANIFSTAQKLGAGGDVVTTLLQGLEHNGISRPLAGLAQAMEGLANPLAASYSTSKRGNVIASNDILSLANLGRIAGGKPFDEAIAIDAAYRFKAYGLGDAKKRQVLGQAIKTTMIAGQDPSLEQIQDFSESYAKTGGRQEQFNSWFADLYKTANLSQTNTIQKNLKDPFNQSMQLLMGGRELRDFTADPE